MKNKSLKLLLVSIICVNIFSPDIEAKAAYQPLEIINIKPAGTGSPAISNTNRIFFAYPGIEYKIRAAVVGGDYPYAYQLSNAPAGMTVDNEGYIRWQNPQLSADNIALRVTDSLGVYIDTTWSISVQTDGFKFVDSNAQTNGDGTISSPYNSIASMTTSAAPTDIIYFRNGTYPVPARGTDNPVDGLSSFSFTSPSSTATRWLVYPGESATIDLENSRYFYGATNIPFYFEGLRFYRGREYFFRAVSNSTYVVFLDNTFDTLTLERTEYNSNQGTYFTMYAGAGHYLIFQGNTFSGYRGTQGIGSLYDQNTTLVENNHFSDFSEQNSTGSVLAFKTGIVNLTLRGNVVNLSADSNFGIFGSSLNAGFSGGTIHGPFSENIEVLYNYFRTAGSGLAEFNRLNNQKTTWAHHNTFVSAFQMTNLAADDCNGPWYFNNNVFQNTASGVSDHYANTVSWATCISEYNANLGATSNLVDENGLLTEGYSSSIGVSGWQFPDGSTPMDKNYINDTIAPNIPANLNVL